MHMKSAYIGLVALSTSITTLVATVEDASANVLERIASRGSISVCSNLNNPPLAFTTPTGDAEGMQIDLLKDLMTRMSDKLGKEIKVNLVPALPANRIQFLQQGKCDMIFTSLTVTEDRKKLIQFVEPYYYAAGPGLQARKDADIPSWESLKGKRVCANQGASWNAPLERTYGAEIVALQSQQEVDQSLRDGRCIALVSDDSYLQSRVISDKDGIWADYKIVDLKPFDQGPWGIAINFKEPELQTLISDTVIDWNKSGRIIDEAAKWGLTPSPYAIAAHEAALKQ